MPQGNPRTHLWAHLMASITRGMPYKETPGLTLGYNLVASTLSKPPLNKKERNDVPRGIRKETRSGRTMRQVHLDPSKHRGKDSARKPQGSPRGYSLESSNKAMDTRTGNPRAHLGGYSLWLQTRQHASFFPQQKHLHFLRREQRILEQGNPQGAPLRYSLAFSNVIFQEK